MLYSPEGVIYFSLAIGQTLLRTGFLVSYFEDDMLPFLQRSFDILGKTLF
jgi:hypothetical protein